MGNAQRAIAAVNRHADALSEAVLTAMGTGAVDTVFVGGSAATGDIAWFAGDDLEILSDVDLYVVLRDGVDAEAARDVAREAARTVEPTPGVRFLRPDDVGVYTRDDLLGQPARPGTVRLAAEHRLIHGNAAIFKELAVRVGAPIAPPEGLYLIENRLFELRHNVPAAGDASALRLRTYRLLKTVMDATNAMLVARACYAPTRDERRRALDAIAAEGGLPDGWDRALVAEALGAWDDLPRALAGAEDGTLEERVHAFAVDTWGAIAAPLYPEARGDWANLILYRCQVGDYKDNFREFVRIWGRLGHARRRLLWVGVHMSRYAPSAALRLSALSDRVALRADLDPAGKRSLESLNTFLDRLTQSCGFVDGVLADRVAAMHRAIA